MIMLNIGMGISFPTVAIPMILHVTEGLSVDEDQASWFGKLLFFNQIFIYFKSFTF